MEPSPDHGEESYRGSGRPAGEAAIVTGGHSGIGRAVAIAFAREGADVFIAYLDEDDDARETARWIEKAGRRALLARGDVTDAQHCDAIVHQAVEVFGKLDVPVNNAAHQSTHVSLDEIGRRVASYRRHQHRRHVQDHTRCGAAHEARRLDRQHCLD
jgi:NAD(P)-dependent dehydrogenase (short-subunit alcohol dehydrogenase family)